MGKGKGNVEYWVCPIKPGKILYEMEGVEEDIARQAFKLAAAKLPFQTQLLPKNEKINLSDNCFGVDYKKTLVHQVITSYFSNFGLDPILENRSAMVSSRVKSFFISKTISPLS